MRTVALLCATLIAVTGCGQTASEIGVPPALSPVGSGMEPDPQSTVHYPQSPPSPLQRHSLWSDSQARLFTDARALSVGDILTVIIRINDRARFQNESQRSRNSSRGMGMGGSLEFGGTGHFPTKGGGVSGSLDLDFSGKSTSTGSGQTARSEAINLSVAAVVTGVMPNGNLIIQGSQEVRVNAELRILTIAGIVRPADIGASNTISYERIAEARISYGGRGRLTEVQQPPYGQQVLDLVLPF